MSFNATTPSLVHTREHRSCVVVTSDCSGNGVCSSLGTCQCDDLFYGKSCEDFCFIDELLPTFTWNGRWV